MASKHCLMMSFDSVSVKWSASLMRSNNSPPVTLKGLTMQLRCSTARAQCKVLFLCQINPLCPPHLGGLSFEEL